MNRIRFSLLNLIGAIALALPAVGAPPAPGAEVQRIDIQPKRIDIQPKIVIEPPRSRDFRVTLTTDKDRYYEGDRINLTYRSNRDAQVYIFDTDTRGVTRQIFPNFYERDNSIRAGRTYHTPDPSYTMRISGPGGHETLRLVAFAKEYRALRQWEDYSRNDPFPQRSISPSRMLDQVGREYADTNREHLMDRRPSSMAPQSIEIVPGQDFDYTETVISFSVISSRYGDHYGDRDRDRDRDSGGYGRGYGWDRGTASLRVSSDVVGADVYVDGYFYGVSPGTFYVSPGRHNLTVSDARYGSRRLDVDVVSGAANSVTVNLRR